MVRSIIRLFLYFFHIPRVWGSHPLKPPSFVDLLCSLRNYGLEFIWLFGPCMLISTSGLCEETSKCLYYSFCLGYCFEFCLRRVPVSSILACLHLLQPQHLSSSVLQRASRNSTLSPNFFYSQSQPRQC